MKHKNKHVEKLNALLRAEVGVNPHGGGLAEWRYLPELRYPAVKIENGREVWEDVVTPGGIITARKKRIEMIQPLRGRYPDHWAICLWAEPNTEEEWARIYGTLENYPAQGVYFWHGPNSSPCLREGLAPTMLTTRQYIDAVKTKRRLALEERLRKMADESDAEKEKAIARNADYFESLAPAFLNLNPGKRGGSVSPQGGVGDSPTLRAKETYAV